MKHSPSLVWFRNDLRLGDNPALTAAIKRGGPIIPVFISAPGEESNWAPGAASRWWLHQSLASLRSDLARVGSRLVLRHGPSLPALTKLVEESGAGAVFWNRRYEPFIISRDKEIKETLRASGVSAESFNGALLIEPWTITNKSGKPFQVFTPFWKTCLDKIAIAQVLLSPPAALTPPERWPQSLSLDELELEPALPWAEGFGTIWKPGTTGAMEKIKSFLKEGFSNYSEARDRPDRSGTSRLSPHLHFGEISPRHVWVAIRKHAFKHHIDEQTWRSSQFITELGWREFSHHLLYHFPTTPNEPLRKEFNFFPWRKSSLFLQAWQKGKTGYPIVDAGMRQLWHTGWMHNRVRMIVASFLVKDLLINWQEGANWFWDTLVDADLAQNTLGWQWVSGCGADAAPYFRVFNPTIQGTKFDPNGDYIRKWVPELNQVPTEWIHQPFKAPLDILARAGVEMDVQYPTPILSHVIAREVALEAYSRLKQREKARG